MTSIVIDASALVEYLLGTEKGAAVQRVLTNPSTDFHVPALCDVEVVSALRHLHRRRLLPTVRAWEALEDYLDLPLTRHGHSHLLARCLDLQHALSAYDATYVALAEILESQLMTMDAGLARRARSLGLTCLPD